MPPQFELRPAKRTNEMVENAQNCFPGSLYGEISLLDRASSDAFRRAVESDNENAIQSAISRCPYLIQYVIPESGHHGTWLFPKSMIRTPRIDGLPGLIPDYLVATRNSLGFTWHIVELKRPSDQFSNAKGDGYSTVGHKAIAQCANYAAHFRDYIETVRSNIGVDELIQPRNVVLVIGDSRMESENQRRCRDNFENITRNFIVSSYDRIFRGLANDSR